MAATSIFMEEGTESFTFESIPWTESKSLNIISNMVN